MVIKEDQVVVGLLDKISIFNLLQQKALEKAKENQQNDETKPNQVDFLLK